MEGKCSVKTPWELLLDNRARERGRVFQIIYFVEKNLASRK